MKKRGIIISILIVIVIGAIAAGIYVNRSAILSTSDKPVQIGAVVFLTGPQAPLGEEVRNTFLLAQDEINVSGGVNGRNIELLIQDSKDSPKDAIAAYNKITMQGVPAVISTGDVVSLNLAPLAKEKQIPLVTTIAAGPDIPKNNDWVFRVWVPAHTQASTLAKYARNELDLSSVALLAINNEYGDASTKHFRETFESKGGTVVGTETFGIMDRDVRAQIAKLKTRDPQAIVIMGFGDGYGAAIRQVRESGYKGLILSENSLSTPYFLQQTEGANEGAIFTSTVYDENSTDPQAKAFIEAYEKRFGRRPSYIGAFAYDALKLLVHAMDQNDSSPENIREALASITDYSGVTGQIGLSQEGEINQSLVIKKIVDGKPVIIRGAK